MVRRYRNGWWLAVKYWDEGLTQAEIAAECDVTPRTIRTYMNEFGIQTRDIQGENHPLHGEQRDEEVREQISESLRGREVSEETRECMVKAREGTELPADVREKISRSLRGRSKSNATREKMSESTSGPRNPNWRIQSTVREWLGPGERAGARPGRSMPALWARWIGIQARGPSQDPGSSVPNVGGIPP